jgi:predicted membrane protein
MKNTVNSSPDKFTTFNKALLKSMGIAFLTGSVIVLVFSQPVESYVDLLSMISLLYGGALLIYMVAAYAIWGLGYFIDRFLYRNESKIANQQIYKFLHNMLVIVIPVFLTIYISFCICIAASLSAFD